MAYRKSPLFSEVECDWFVTSACPLQTQTVHGGLMLTL